MNWTERPPLAPKHMGERLKLAASGVQAVAITLLAGVVIAPELNPGLIAPLWTKVAAGAIAGIGELAAFKLLSYIPIAMKEPTP